MWADYITPDESTAAEVMKLRPRRSRMSSIDSMEYVSCHSYS